MGKKLMLIVELYKRNAGTCTTTPGKCLVPKLKYEHVYLNQFCKMRVDLAASCCQCCNFKHTQVLSETVSKVLYFSCNEFVFHT